MTELLSVRLSKPWGPHKAGETVQVDPARAATLRAEGYVAKEPAPKKAAKG